MNISLITDEISSDPETALELGVEWGVHDFELRGFGTDRVPIFSVYQKTRLKELLDEYEARVIAISPGLFKCPYPLGQRERFPLHTIDFELHQRWQSALDLVKYHLEELLPLSIEYAQEIGAHLIVVFSFHRGGKPARKTPEEVLLALHQAAKKAEEANVKLAIEVEAGYWADTGRHTAEIIQAIEHPSLGVNWDPGNAFEAGDTPFPDGYQKVQPFVQHVHFKDLERDSGGHCTYVIEGQIDWAGQVEALFNDGYDGHISVEPHMQPKVRSVKAMTERLRTLIKSVEG